MGVITRLDLFPRTAPAVADCHLNASFSSPPLPRQADASDIISGLLLCSLEYFNLHSFVAVRDQRLWRAASPAGFAIPFLS
jgi:hypothetical protein